MQKKKNIIRRRLDDLRKKYPVDEILSKAESFSIEETAKKFNINKSTVSKIIKRYGNDELRKIVSSRHPKAKKELEVKALQQESEKFIGKIGEKLKELMIPLQNYAEIKKELNEERDRLKKTICEGNETIKIIVKALAEKEIDPEKIEKLKHTLNGFIEYKLAASRLYLDYLKAETTLQESFIKIEVLAKKMEGTKNILDTFFKSLNLLSGKEYRAIKEFITRAHPFTVGLFSKYEESIKEFRQRKLAEINQNGGDAASEGTETREDASTNTNK